MAIYTDLNQYEQAARNAYKDSEIEGWQLVLQMAIVTMGQILKEAARTGKTQTWFDAITSEPSILFQPTGQIEFL